MSAHLVNEARSQTPNGVNPETTLDRMSVSNSNDRNAALQAGRTTRALESLMDEAERLAQGTLQNRADRTRDPGLTRDARILPNVSDKNIAQSGSLAPSLAQSREVVFGDRVTALDPQAQADARTKADSVNRTAVGVRGDSLALSGQLQDMIVTMSAESPPPGISYTDWLSPAAQAQRQKMVGELQLRRSQLDQTGAKAGTLEARGETFTPNGPSQDRRS